jgi:hypothetical protein
MGRTHVLVTAKKTCPESGPTSSGPAFGVGHFPACGRPTSADLPQPPGFSMEHVVCWFSLSGGLSRAGSLVVRGFRVPTPSGVLPGQSAPDRAAVCGSSITQVTPPDASGGAIRIVCTATQTVLLCARGWSTTSSTTGILGSYSRPYYRLHTPPRGLKGRRSALLFPLNRPRTRWEAGAPSMPHWGHSCPD